MGERQAHMVGHPAGHDDVLLRVLVGRARQEDQPTEAAIETQWDLEHRSCPLRATPAVAVGADIGIFLDIRN